MRISDWSSDVCSSDLVVGRDGGCDLASAQRHDAAKILRPAALDHGRYAKLIEQMPEAVDVGQARQVAQRERLVGEQRAGEQRERSVLRDGNGKAAFPPFAAKDEHSVHVPLLQPNLPCPSGPTVKRSRLEKKSEVSG